MLLRHATIIFLVGFGIGIFSLFYIQNISPFKKEKIEALISEKQITEEEDERLNTEINILVRDGKIISYLSPNIFLGIIIILVSISCFFISAHLCIDKLFFKKFFEKASYFDAIRRGIILSLILATMLYFKLSALTFLEIMLVPIIFTILEVIFVMEFREKVIRKVEELMRKERLETQPSKLLVS